MSAKWNVYDYLYLLDNLKGGDLISDLFLQ